MSWRDHPLPVAAASVAVTLGLAAAIVFTAVIPTWLQRKENEIADLKTQVQSLAAEPTTLKIQLAKHEREAAKRIEELDQRLEAERLAKTAAEQRAADESALRRQMEEGGRKKDELGATRAQKEFEKRIKDLEQQLGTERAAKEAAESRLRQEAEERARKSDDPGSISNQSVTAKSFDLGNITAAADWARSNRDQLEISFTFTNKTTHPLWLIPATPRFKGGIQASDDVKNSYELVSTGGFRRGSLSLRGDPRSQNEFLELQPGVPSPATFNFTRKRGGNDGATNVRFFATLAIVEDLQTLKSYNKTVTAIINLK
jgi:hypothetical protein